MCWWWRLYKYFWFVLFNFNSNSKKFYYFIAYTDRAIISGLPFGYKYQFKIKIYDLNSNSWSLDSESTVPIDMNINLDLNLKIDVKRESLLVSWKIDNHFDYYVSRYFIAVSKNGSNFTGMSDSQFLSNNNYKFGLNWN